MKKSKCKYVDQSNPIEKHMRRLHWHRVFEAFFFLSWLRRMPFKGNDEKVPICLRVPIPLG
jgi:hypothetical protein